MGYLQHLGQQYQLIEQRLNFESVNCGDNSTIIRVLPEASVEESIYSQKTDETVDSEVESMSPSKIENNSLNSQKPTTKKYNKETQEDNIVVIRAKNRKKTANDISNSIDSEHIVTQAKVVERIHRRFEVRFICKTNKDAEIILKDLRIEINR